MGLFSEPVQARSTGFVDRSGNPDTGDGQTCTSCHLPGAVEPGISITAPTSVEGGETIDLAVTISGGPGVIGGFNASFSDFAGTLLADDIETRIQSSQITHTGPKPFTGGAVRFRFSWTAPSEAGEVVLYAAGVSANQAGGNTGDGVASTSFVIDVQPAEILGDVNCTGDLNIVDALLVAQFAALVREDGGDCPLADPATQLAATRGNINQDATTNIVDALLIAQCAASIDLDVCPDAGEAN